MKVTTSTAEVDINLNDMAKSDKEKELVEKLKGYNHPEGKEQNLVDYDEVSRQDAIKLLDNGMSIDELRKEIVEQGWDDASPIYKIISGDDNEGGKIVKTIETTTVEMPEEDATKSFFKAMGKKHDEENHWKDYKPQNRDLSKNKNKHIIY